MSFAGHRISRRSVVARCFLVAGVAAGFGAGLIAQGAPGARADAPFVSLATGHAGRPYQDVIAFPGASKNFRVTAGSLPDGLTLNNQTGVVSGTPLGSRVAHVRVAAQDGQGVEREGRIDIAILTPNETEVVRGQSFEATGPYTTSKRTLSMQWKSSFDQKTRPATVIVYAPQGTVGGRPLLVFHRGRGFGHDDYHDFLGRIASWGIVCASMSDEQSFYNPRNPNAAEFNYDGSRAELGMESASAAQEATLDFVLGLAADPQDALAGMVDPENVFFAGHSRGGGATHGSHVREATLRAKGVIYFMAFDLRYFDECRMPGTAPAYGVPTAQDRLPSLVISAGNDGDLTYPIADEFIDRATGPTTFVTVYGGVHNFLGDANADEGGATISRLDEQKRVGSFVVAFIRRWSLGDVSLDGYLYGNEHAGSKTVGVSSWRRTSPTLLVEDFQDASTTTNKLGGSNTLVNLRETERSAYPSTGDYASLGLRHGIITFDQNQWSAFRMGFGARDVSGYRNVIARVLQTKTSGWNVALWGQLADTSGQTATVKIASGQADLGYLPPRTVRGDRFVSVFMPLAQFKAQNPSINLGSINRVALSFQTTGSDTRQVVVDDVRFE